MHHIIIKIIILQWQSCRVSQCVNASDASNTDNNNANNNSGDTNTHTQTHAEALNDADKHTRSRAHTYHTQNEP